MIRLYNRRSTWIAIFFNLVIVADCTNGICWGQDLALVKNGAPYSSDKKIIISKLTPSRQGGQAYRLVYFVQVPLDVFWRFKTDFENDFVIENKYIREHKVISQKKDQVITKNKYENSPNVYFKWQTSVNANQHRLDFKLLNPGRCRQKFHYGYILLESVPGGTQVTQVAYFDFFGASLWVNYPFRGGMKDFLTYTAQWEQRIILKLKDRYRTDEH